MAGGHGHHQPLRLDPALERWAAMRENVYQTFAFTKRASRIALILGILVPGSIAALAVTYDNKYDWAGKMRGSALTSGTPAQPAKPEE